MLNSGGNLKWFSTLEALSLILMPHWFILYRPNQMEISIFQKESQVSSPADNRITKPRVLSVSLWMMAKYPDAASEAERKLNCFLLPSKNCTTTDHLNEDHMIYCLSAYLHFLLTSAMLKVAESELLCVDPTRPRHCSFLLISRGPHLAKTPNKAICPYPRSAAIFAQPQCVLACSAEHHMWQDFDNDGRKALLCHLWTLFMLQPCYLDVCRASLALRGGGMKAICPVSVPSSHSVFFFFYTGKRGLQPPPLNSRSKRRPRDHSGPKWQLSSQLSRPSPHLSWGISAGPNR